MEGFFASCGPPPARNELRGESSTRPPSPDMPDRDRSTPYRPPCTASAFPAKEAPRVSDRPAFPRRSGPTIRQQLPSSPTSPSGIAARHLQAGPSLPGIGKRQSSARIASRPAACLQPTYQRVCPTDPPLHGRKAPSHTSRGMPAARKQARERKRERKIPALFTPQLSPSILPDRMACLISNSRQTTTETFVPT